MIRTNPDLPPPANPSDFVRLGLHLLRKPTTSLFYFSLGEVLTLTRVLFLLLAYVSCISILVADSVPGCLLIKVQDEIQVLRTELILETDRAWFNKKVPTYSITSIRKIGEDLIPPQYASNFLYYTVQFDTTYSVDAVVSDFASEGPLQSCNIS